MNEFVHSGFISSLLAPTIARNHGEPEAVLSLATRKGPETSVSFTFGL